MSASNELMLVKNPLGNNCVIEREAKDNPFWACERFNECRTSNKDCPSGQSKVFIKKSDMVRYAALKLVS